MIAFTSMLVEPAKKAGIEIPNVENIEDFKYWIDECKEQYPYFCVYCILQLGASMPRPTSHWYNAEIIAGLTLEELKSFCYDDFVKAGCEFGVPIP